VKKYKYIENPFIYGEAVTGKNFCDRNEEIARLKMDLMSSQKVFLISSRKMGKTSLIKMVLEEIKKEGLTAVFVDIEGFSSYKDFLDGYLLELVKEFTTTDRIVSFIRSALPGLRVEIKINESGGPVLSLGYSRSEPDLEKVATKIYNIPEIIVRKKKKKVVIVFDEFQEILKLNGKKIEGILRGIIQHQRDVGYIFAGSKKHLLTDMVSSPGRPFYKIGPVMHLKKIPEKDFLQFAKSKFESTKVRISDETLCEIIEIAENIPYYVQMFCHELWDYRILKKEIKREDVKLVVNQVAKQHSQDFYLGWSRMILSKRRLLRAIATQGGHNIFSQRFLKGSELGYPSSVSRTLSALMEEGYLERENDEYFITDLLFREWIKNL